MHEQQKAFMAGDFYRCQISAMAAFQKYGDIFEKRYYHRGVR